MGSVYQEEERICIVVSPTYMSTNFKKQYGDLTTFSLIRIHGKILAMRCSQVGQCQLMQSFKRVTIKDNGLFEVQFTKEQ